MAWSTSRRAAVAVGTVAVAALALGPCVFGTAPTSTVDLPPTSIPGEKIKPPECAGAVAVVCGDMISIAFRLLSGQFGSDYIGPTVVTVLPDGRLRYIERSTDQERPEFAIEHFAGGMRLEDWTELPGSQPLKQRWEQRTGVATPLVLTAEFRFEGVPTPEGDQQMTLVGTIETIEPVVRRP